MKKFFNEFKEFISRGNVLNLAVGVIIGAAFQSIVKSLTDDIISPVIGLLVKTDFKDLAVVVKEAVLDEAGEVLTPEVAIRYGAFITAIINFFIMALVIFLLVKFVNKLMDLGKKKEEPAEPQAPTTKVCPFCKSEIAIEATRCPYCTSEIKE